MFMRDAVQQWKQLIQLEFLPPFLKGDPSANISFTEKV